MKLFLALNGSFGLHYDPANGVVNFTCAVTPDGIEDANRRMGTYSVEVYTISKRLCPSNISNSPHSSSYNPEYLYGEIGPATNGETGTVFLRLKSGTVTSNLVKLFGSDVTLKVSISNMYISDYGTLGSFETSEMEIQHHQKYACEDADLFKGNHASGFYYSFLNNRQIKGNLTIMATVNEPTDSSGAMCSSVVTDKMQAYRKMLQEELGTDVVIIAGNGIGVKAHKCMLLAHSDVFKAMFQSDLEEAKTHIIQMPDMSEEGVRGLLAFLYCWETTEPNSKPEVAFEMLNAGHKYDIPVLEAAMKKLFLGKPTSWYNVDIALKLILVARNLPVDGDRLKMKAVKVLKMNFGNFKSSPIYKDLFKKDPEIAMEICEFAFGA